MMNPKWKTLSILWLAVLIKATASTSNDADIAAEYCGEKGKLRLQKTLEISWVEQTLKP